MITIIDVRWCWTCHKWTQHDVEQEVVRRKPRDTRQVCRDCGRAENIQSNVRPGGGMGDQRLRVRRARSGY